MLTPYPAEWFRRQDETDDEQFYLPARLVVHIDDGAIAALSELLGRVLPVGGAYLDLMSSWRSHLPAGLSPQSVTGLGMNAAEMADNPQLTSYVVQNLNRNPALPFPDATFDAALCTVSIQYLIKPLDVFREVGRVLRPGAPFVVSFSNRCFPTKAVAAWLAGGDAQHVALVKDYFDRSGIWGQVETFEKHGGWLAGDPLYALWAQRRSPSEEAAP